MSPLHNYCEARIDRAFGWKARYEAGKHPAWLAGHYNTMLDELLDLLGPAKVAAAIDALAALEPKAGVEEPQVGDLIVTVGCPCCGARLEVFHEDEGEVGVVGERRPTCDQCGTPKADWQDVNADRCPNHANPHGSCDGKLTP